MKNLVTYFLDRSLFVNIVSIILLVAGLIAISRAQREAFPKIEFDYVVITTIFPGATQEDVEKHVTISIENQLRTVDGIEEISSGSYESLSSIAIKLDPDLDDKTKVISDIKNAVDRTADLPDEAEKPFVFEIAMDMMSVMELAIINEDGIHNDADEFENRHYAKMLEDRLLEIDGVARIEKSGYREREMLVEADPVKLAQEYVGINELIYRLSQKNLNFPGGMLKSKEGEILIRTIGEVQTAKEIEEILVRSNDVGDSIRVKDIARVLDTFEEEKMITKADGNKTIILNIMKKESADIIDVVEEVKETLSDFKKVLPENYRTQIMFDMSFYVRRRLNVLVNNAIIGFFLVISTLFLSFGWRISLVTAIGLPLAFFGTFVWMDFNDVSVNLMSMFGLIMVLGMLVDDAIIVAENIYRHLEEKVPLKRAVQNGVSEVITPVAATVLTTVSAFAPLMFMQGIMGKFVWVMPAVVSVALLFSWAECMFILPSHIYDIEKKLGKPSGRLKNKKGIRKWLWIWMHRAHPVKENHEEHLSGNEGTLMHRAREIYRSFLIFTLGRRYIALGILFIFFAGTTTFSLWKIDFILFPRNGIEALIIKAETATGTTLQETSEKLGKLERIIGQLPDSELDNFSTLAGVIQENPMDPNSKSGASYGTIRINLTPFYTRERDGEQIMEHLRNEFKAVSSDFVKMEINQESHGPPVGQAVQVTVKGNEFPVIEKIVSEYKEYLSTLKGVRDIKDNYEGGKEELRVYLKPEEAARAGVSVFDVATTIRSCYEGTVATTIKKTDEEINIRVKFPATLLHSAESLGKVKIANKRGNLIPLNSVVYFEKDRGISVLNRKDWRRTVSVTAEIEENVRDINSLIVNTALQKKFADIEERYPGYTVSYEGEFKDTEESMAELLQSFLIAIMIIYLILVSLFRSLVYPLIILMVIPMTFTGVVWIFFFHNLPISFLAALGVVGLAGVVVNDSILLMDFIKKARNRGVKPLQAAIESGVTRLRPVFLTTVTTFFGLIPTAYGIGGYDPFLKPMAISLSWGLVFGTTVTLVGIPIIYTIFSDMSGFLFRKKGI